MAGNPIEEKIDVEVTGGMAFATVDVEAQGIPLDPTTFKGSREKVELSAPDVSILCWVKGGIGAEFKVKVTINGESWETKGTLTTGAVKRTRKVPFATFKLPRGQEPDGQEPHGQEPHGQEKGK